MYTAENANIKSSWALLPDGARCTRLTNRKRNGASKIIERSFTALIQGLVDFLFVGNNTTTLIN